jgi:hypothetical protein
VSIVRALAALSCGLTCACSGANAASTADGGSGNANGSCSSTSSFPASPLATMSSDGGKLDVAVRAAPYQPLIAGLQCVELVVTDPSTGAGVDGLEITMTPWMPAMGHGASVTPLLTPLGEGRYVFTDVSLFMPGEWQLRVQFSGGVSDSVEPTFNVD